MNVLIVEDEIFAAERLERILKKRFPYINVIGQTDTIRDTVAFLTNAAKEPDLIFCDIQLADGLSFEIFKQVQTEKPIIFTTAYEEHSIEAFNVNSVHYLLKPINEEALAAAIEKYEKVHGNKNQSLDMETVSKLLPKKQKRFLVRAGIKLIPKKEEEISIFFIGNKVVQLLDREGKSFLTDFSLEELEKEELSQDHFFRINRKYLVNKESIASIKPHENQRLLLTLNIPNRFELVVSREKVSEFKKWFLD